mmetsp:Transcript_46324/g.149292  ORF Transcript_46324/g.149292 Transcript_46324/m.149292 type:complete len:356 (+) Transcript_46324:203-1270(+)
MNGIARVRGPRRQWLSRSCHAREAVEAPLAHRDVAHVGQRQLLLRPDARARHRHEKARPQRVAARRGVHHLGKGDVGLGGVGGRGARVAKAAVGVVGPPDDDVAAALARDGVYGAGQIAGNLPLPVHAPPHAAHRHRAVCDLDRPAQVGLLERGLHPAATDGTGRNREEGGQPRRAEHPVHPRDVARVLRGQHQLRPRALSSARLKLVVVWLDQRVHLAAAVGQLHQSERDHAVHRVHLREVVVEVDLVVCEDCGEACRRDERLNGRLWRWRRRRRLRREEASRQQPLIDGLLQASRLLVEGCGRCGVGGGAAAAVHVRVGPRLDRREKSVEAEVLSEQQHAGGEADVAGRQQHA